MIKYRKATLDELGELIALLWKEGPNEWNYLTQEGVENEFLLVENGSATAFVATDSEEIIGMAVLIKGSACPEYLLKYGTVADMYFIGDVVVVSSHSGQGIATQLLKICIEDAKGRNAKRVLIERHEENKASAGMMRNAGFNLIDTFYDPEKRESGSRNTCILEKLMS